MRADRCRWPISCGRGKHSQAAGVNGHALGEAVLGGEIGDQLAAWRGCGRLHVGVEALAGKLILGDVARVEGGALEGGLSDAPSRTTGLSRIPSTALDRGGGREWDGRSQAHITMCGQFRAFVTTVAEEQGERRIP